MTFWFRWGDVWIIAGVSPLRKSARRASKKSLVSDASEKRSPLDASAKRRANRARRRDCPHLESLTPTQRLSPRIPGVRRGDPGTRPRTNPHLVSRREEIG